MINHKVKFISSLQEDVMEKKLQKKNINAKIKWQQNRKFKFVCKSINSTSLWTLIVRNEQRNWIFLSFVQYILRSQFVYCIGIEVGRCWYGGPWYCIAKWIGSADL